MTPQPLDLIQTAMRALAWVRETGRLNFVFSMLAFGGDPVAGREMYVHFGPDVNVPDREAALRLIDRAPEMYRQLRTSQMQMDSTLRPLVQLLDVLDDDFDIPQSIVDRMTPLIDELSTAANGLQDVSLANQRALR